MVANAGIRHMLADVERHLSQPTEILHLFKHVVAQPLPVLLQKSPDSADEKRVETAGQLTSYSIS